MGSTWEVRVWKPLDWNGGEYGYEQVWQGESALSALWQMVKAKRAGYGCVTLGWR